MLPVLSLANARWCRSRWEGLMVLTTGLWFGNRRGAECTHLDRIVKLTGRLKANLKGDPNTIRDAIMRA